jgi:hypothetical protein
MSKMKPVGFSGRTKNWGVLVGEDFKSAVFLEKKRSG